MTWTVHPFGEAADGAVAALPGFGIPFARLAFPFSPGRAALAAAVAGAGGAGAALPFFPLFASGSGREVGAVAALFTSFFGAGSLFAAAGATDAADRGSAGGGRTVAAAEEALSGTAGSICPSSAGGSELVSGAPASGPGTVSELLPSAGDGAAVTAVAGSAGTSPGGTARPLRKPKKKAAARRTSAAKKAKRSCPPVAEIW
jgi:hypothetical protein